MTGPAPSVVVAMLTYRRPDDLATAIPTCLAAMAAARLPATSRLVVVDNDPDASARAYVEGLGDRPVSYVHEPRPGIAAGRNRALDEVSTDGGTDVLVFIDDDERPLEGWLDALVNTWMETGAAAVVGAVVAEFSTEPDPFIVAGRFFERPRRATGTPVPAAATNNLLLDVAQVRASGVRFDERFGLSGGSDTLFTRQLARWGGALVWCDEAVVVDRVPPDRLTKAWMLRRIGRSGNSEARVALALARGPVERSVTRVRFLVGGAARVLMGAGRYGAGLLIRSARQSARGRRGAARGRGMISGAVGSVVVEYARPV